MPYPRNGRVPRPLPPNVTSDEEQQAWVQRYLRHRISEHGITPAEFATQLGLNKATIYHWLGKRPSSPMSVTTARVIYWLFHGPLKDENYWRERALRAEYTLDHLKKVLTQAEEEQKEQDAQWQEPDPKT